MAEDGLLTADNPASTGEETSDVFASIPKEVRFSADGNDKLARFQGKGISDIAASYLELEKVSSGHVKIPNDTSTPEEKSAFYKKTGRPDTVDGYNLPELAEGQAYDTELVNTMRAVAFDSGVSDKQFSGMVAKFVEAQGVAEQARVAAENLEAETTVKELQAEWGADYEKNLEVSKRALRELVPEAMKDELVNLIVDKNLDNNKLFVKFLQSVGATTLDDTFVKGEKVVEKTDDYVPKYVNSPSMYKNDESEDGLKAKAYFKAHGIEV